MYLRGFAGWGLFLIAYLIMAELLTCQMFLYLQPCSVRLLYDIITK